MLCQKCNENRAIVHFMQVINGAKMEWWLCENCAGDVDMPKIKSFDINMSDFLGNYLSGSTVRVPTIMCKSCGMTYEKFSQQGKLGCCDCYETFQKQLELPLKRIHGATSHIGKIPSRLKAEDGKIVRLKKDLADAVACEDFENAARLRDEIRAITEGGEAV